MRSGRIKQGERVVWVGDPSILSHGSSTKAREVTRTHVAVDAHVLDGSADRDSLSWRRRGTEIVSCVEAAKRGIEPWSKVWDESGKVRPRPKREGSYNPPRVVPTNVPFFDRTLSGPFPMTFCRWNGYFVIRDYYPSAASVEIALAKARR